MEATVIKVDMVTRAGTEATSRAATTSLRAVVMATRMPLRVIRAMLVVLALRRRPLCSSRLSNDAQHCTQAPVQQQQPVQVQKSGTEACKPKNSKKAKAAAAAAAAA